MKQCIVLNSPAQVSNTPNLNLSGKSIYLLINQDNWKIYVGCTERQIKWRAHEHLKALKHNKHSIEEMQKDYNNMKKEFVVVLVETGLSPKEAGEAELDWMIRLNTFDKEYGYNYKDCQLYRNGKPIGKLKKHLENVQVKEE